MSDLLICLGQRYAGRDLLTLLQAPYGGLAPAGRFLDLAWGAVAVLEERLAGGRNMLSNGAATLAWVGDLVIDARDGFVESFATHLSELQQRPEHEPMCLTNDRLFEKLNGTFAIVWASPTGLSIVTDPISFVPVYVGRDTRGAIVAFGTHADLVATVADDSVLLDSTSAAEFLNSGRCTYPNTMHAHVKEMKPGRLHHIRVTGEPPVSMIDAAYWVPPEELCEGHDDRALVHELTALLRTAVRSRCNDGKVAVLLSGGLDSRVTASSITSQADCLCLTFCDRINRETTTAKRVAEQCGHDWALLVRDQEFLGNSVVPAVKLVGCEAQWVDAHTIGHVQEIAAHHAHSVLSSFLFDMYLKGMWAYDFARVKHLGGLLPASYRPAPFDYVHSVTDFWQRHLEGNAVESLYDRRERRYTDNLDPSRSSMVEWLTAYPYSQNLCTFWPADRRVLPMRLVMGDRPLLDFAFKCPVHLKLGARMLLKAARPIYGRTGHIPCANDGVRPASGHWWRLAQRAVRKVKERPSRVFRSPDRGPRVEHSWSDYQRYWQESAKLAQLGRDYGGNLSAFEGSVLRPDSRALLSRSDIDWQNGFRLLQLAVWMDVIRGYRAQAKAGR